MPATRPTWEPLDLTEFDDVRIVEDAAFADTYTPPAPAPEPEPAPGPRLRHRQSWTERHAQDVTDIRDALDMAKSNLHYTRDGCRAVSYAPEVRAQVDAAIDRVTEALRLMDIYDPE